LGACRGWQTCRHEHRAQDAPDGVQRDSLALLRAGRRRAHKVLFTNSGTTANTRMGCQAGLHRGNLIVARSGFWPDPDVNSVIPREGSYTLDDPPYLEWWGEGVTVFHNPHAKHPLPHDFFSGANQVYRRGNDILADGSKFSPYLSRTLTFLFNGETFTPVDSSVTDAGTILRVEFEELEPQRNAAALAMLREVTWFTTKQRHLLCRR
jgi:hypothetical protein